MRGDYGTDLASSLFENALIAPEDSVKDALRKWLPHIKVEAVNISQVQDTFEVEVIFTTPDNVTVTTSVGVVVPGERA